MVLDTRDLGGHLSTQVTLNGSTLTQRLRRANTIASKLCCMPWDFEAKQKMIEALIYPLGLYGCEACPAAEKEIAKLKISVAKAVGPYSQSSSNALSFIMSKKGKDLSITNALLQRSFALLRRFVVKHPGPYDQQHLSALFGHW